MFGGIQRTRRLNEDMILWIEGRPFSTGLRAIGCSCRNINCRQSIRYMSMIFPHQKKKWNLCCVNAITSKHSSVKPSRLCLAEAKDFAVMRYSSGLFYRPENITPGCLTNSRSSHALPFQPSTVIIIISFMDHLDHPNGVITAKLTSIT